MSLVLSSFLKSKDEQKLFKNAEVRNTTVKNYCMPLFEGMGKERSANCEEEIDGYYMHWTIHPTLVCHASLPLTFALGGQTDNGYRYTISRECL